MANSVPKIIYNNGVDDITIQFQYPPQGLDFEGKNYNSISKISESSNGNLQTSLAFIELQRNLRFRLVKEDIKALLETFMISHAMLGKFFKYYVHSDEVEFEDVQLQKNAMDFRPKRTGWNSQGDFTYEIDLKMRRVL